MTIKKAEQAKRLLKESGVDYVLAYVNGEKCTAIYRSYRSCPAHKRNVQQAEALQRLYLSRC